MIIDFEARPYRIGEWTVLRLPETASLKLPTRGMTMVEGNINGVPFLAPAEPDGRGSHWFRMDESLCEAAAADEKDSVTVSIEPVKDWPEPEVPADLEESLAADPSARELWLGVTTRARWDWLRWINSTKNPRTRQSRIDKALSKLSSGMKNPCCFNRTLCTEPAVCKGGALLEPTEHKK